MMRRRFLGACTALVSWPVMAGGAVAEDRTFQAALQKIGPARGIGVILQFPRFMRMYGNAQPPYGFLRYCETSPEQCEGNANLNDARLDVGPEQLVELDEVNRDVNNEIEPATDMEIYGVNEFWTIPTKRGDCEDFALLKRQRLIEKGWPASALLITVVRDEKNEGHAILTARTSQGDFVLDNKNDQVKIWSITPYHYVMRQSYIDPKIWVSLDRLDGVLSASAAKPEEANAQPQR